MFFRWGSRFSGSWQILRMPNKSFTEIKTSEKYSRNPNQGEIIPSIMLANLSFKSIFLVFTVHWERIRANQGEKRIELRFEAFFCRIIHLVEYWQNYIWIFELRTTELIYIICWLDIFQEPQRRKKRLLKLINRMLTEQYHTTWN